MSALDLILFACAAGLALFGLGEARAARRDGRSYWWAVAEFALASVSLLVALIPDRAIPALASRAVNAFEPATFVLALLSAALLIAAGLCACVRSGVVGLDPDPRCSDPRCVTAFVFPGWVSVALRAAAAPCGLVVVEGGIAGLGVTRIWLRRRGASVTVRLEGEVRPGDRATAPRSSAPDP